jgi:fatty-acid desaturase
LWLFAHYAIALVGGLMTISWDAVAVFLATTAITLCLGHSLGMHRKLIHNSYACPRWMEYLFVHLGVLVGMAGPFGMVRTHDLRDWAQRQPDCHPYLRHGERMLKDAWWQLHCELRLIHAPCFQPEPNLAKDRVYRFMEQTWMLQQLPLAVLLFGLGGVALPGSAVLGLFENQPNPGWWVLKALHKLGLVSRIVLPENLPMRKGLRPLTARAAQASTEVIVYTPQHR